MLQRLSILLRGGINSNSNNNNNNNNTMGTGSFAGVKRPGRGADHPPPSKCRGQERVGLYFYSPSGPSWPVMGAHNKTNCNTFSFPCRLLRIIHPASFCETCQCLEFPLNGLQAQSRVSPVGGLLSLAFAQSCFGMAFLPFLHWRDLDVWDQNG